MSRDNESLFLSARKFVSKFCRRSPDREQLMADIASTAWEIGLRAPQTVTNTALIWFAARRVSSNRQFRESIRCIQTIPKDKRASRHEFRRVAFRVDQFASGSDPVESAIFRIDVPVWLKSLPAMKRKVATMLAVGEKTTVIARELGVNPSYISNLRRELHADWIAKHS